MRCNIKLNYTACSVCVSHSKTGGGTAPPLLKVGGQLIIIIGYRSTINWQNLKQILDLVVLV